MKDSATDEAEVVLIASPQSRLLAFLIDIFFIEAIQLAGVLFGGVVAATILGFRHAPERVIAEATETGMILGWCFWGSVAFLLNYGVLQGLWEGTLGKIICGTRVVRMDGRPLGIFRSLLRTFAYLASGIPIYFGFIWIIWSKKAQCWHDILSGTYVIQKPEAGNPLTESFLGTSEENAVDRAA